MDQRAETISRRELLYLTLASPFAAALLPSAGYAQRPTVTQLSRQSFLSARGRVVPLDAGNSPALKLERRWSGAICTAKVTNSGKTPIRVKEVVMFEIPHSMPAGTRIYGEGFQMLSQTGGTISEFVDYGSHTDAKHYKMPIPAGARAFYGMMTLAYDNGDNDLIAFT